MEYFTKIVNDKKTKRQKGYSLLRNIFWENVVYTITFLVKIF